MKSSIRRRRGTRQRSEGVVELVLKTMQLQVRQTDLRLAGMKEVWVADVLQVAECQIVTPQAT